MRINIVAIGCSRSIEALRIIGADVHLVKKDELEEDYRKAEVVDAILRSRMVIIEDDIYVIIKDLLRHVLEKIREPPLIVVVPDLGEKRTTRLEELHKLISKAVGVELKWKK
ncbi:MAG: hypothetical protein J7J99_06920 [Thermoprotei archaeon]|nr:hypothetical protein [Thermoprotei archaeon]